jgi:hypothetical protein
MLANNGEMSSAHAMDNSDRDCPRKRDSMPEHEGIGTNLHRLEDEPEDPLAIGEDGAFPPAPERRPWRRATREDASPGAPEGRTDEEADGIDLPRRAAMV